MSYQRERDDLSYLVVQMTDEAAMKHTRLVHGLTGKPEISIGWRPYNFYVLHNGSVSAWAAHTETEFDNRRRAGHLSEPQWGEWQNGIRSAWMDVSH